MSGMKNIKSKDRGRTQSERGATRPATVAASLSFHWYDEIAAGRKRIEYRDICDYWTRRLWADGMAERIGAIKFTRGYTPVSMTWEVTAIKRDDVDGVYEIHLGERIS